MELIRKYLHPLIILIIFETVAVTLWLTKHNLFYLFNFSYIGLSISFGIFLFIRKYRHARRVVQLLVGLYMLVYLGLICNENMQIEGFWYYLFSGVFEAATIHYDGAVMHAGRPWCLTSCRIRRRHSRERRSVGSDISRFFCRCCSYQRCSLQKPRIWSVSCSGRL